MTESIKTSWQAYHQNPRLNFSSLKLLANSARKFHHNREIGEPPADPTRADNLRLGRCIHLAILEPEMFERLPVWRGGKRAGHAWTDFKAEHRIDFGNDYISVHEDKSKCDLTRCLQIQMAVHEHPVAGPYLREPGESERTIFWTHRHGAECKSRIDRLSSRIIDIKSTVDATANAFARSAARYRYWMQAAFYQDAVRSVTGERLPYYWLALEKTPPYDLAVYRARDEDIAVGRFDYERLLAKLSQYGDRWPSINDDQETELVAPPWAFDDDFEVVMGGVA